LTKLIQFDNLVNRGSYISIISLNSRSTGQLVSLINLDNNIFYCLIKSNGRPNQFLIN
jgi:hypothetical protein